jgi:Tol biopolymer transport system component
VYLSEAMLTIRSGVLPIFLCGLLPCGEGSTGFAAAEPVYTIAFASFGPLNSDVFLAEPDGTNPQPLVPHPSNDYNASYSADGSWIIFTSHRNGSADIYRVRPDGTDLERLTDDAAFDDQAALSPDGTQLVFVSNRGGHANLWHLDLASKKVSRLTKHDNGDFRPAWSPDGKWIAFSSDRDSTKPKSRAGFGTVHSTEIYIMRPDGSDLQRLTRAQAFAGTPAWSPDSKKLVVYEATLTEVQKIAAPRRLRGTTQIATIDIATGDRSVLTLGVGEKWSPSWLTEGRISYVSGGPEGGIEFTNGAAGARGQFLNPSWSQDGRRMVFHRDVVSDWPPFGPWHSRDPQFRVIRAGVYTSSSPVGDRLVYNDRTAAILRNSIWVMNSDGSRRKLLFKDAEKSALAPVWSPRGDKIAFGYGLYFQTILGPAVADIAVIDTDGTGLKVLTDGKANHGFPSWAPDGKRLVYRSSDGKTGGLFILDIATGKTTELKTSSTRVNFPAWSPTGDLIAFTSYLDGDYEICTLKSDGTGEKRLTHSPGNDAHCAWSPDGKWIAFVSQRGGFKDEVALYPYNGQAYGKIYVMRSDGSDVRQITDDAYEHGTPSFVPPIK